MIVLDTSMFLAALLPDEQQPSALALYQMVLGGEEEAAVPPIFLYEACNVVMHAQRRKRIDHKAKEAYLEIICNFPAQVDMRQKIPDVAQLAEKHTLTMYDASYLELCKHFALPLATLDKNLTAAAKKERVPVLA